MSAVGRRVRRLEDHRLLRGRGRFVDDVDRPGQLWMRVVRSQVAHGDIRAIHADEARAIPGVVAVLTGEDLADVGPIPVRTRVSEHDLEPFLQPVLARGRVRYVGEPVAVVAAEDGYLAEDAAESVLVEIEGLPVSLEARSAAEPGAPALRLGRRNEVAVLDVGYGDVEGAFARAAHVVEAEVAVGRHSGGPLETRGLLVEPDPAGGRLEIWGATKVPHFNREVLAAMLGLPVEGIRLHPTDAGGGFGIRGELYPEDFLVAFLALSSGRPVKWIEDRAEHLVAANHSRQQLHRVAAGFDGDGRLLALRDEVWHDQGAYIRTHGVIVPELTVTMLPGPYRVPAYRGTVHVVVTNKTPCGTYRGPGRYEGTFVREHLLDLAAHRLGIDRIEIRRRNLLDAAELPHRRELTTIGTEMILDAGDYRALLDRALEGADFAEWVREAESLRREGRPAGTGIGIFLEKSGLGPYESAAVGVDGTGLVRVTTGGASLGQGIETVLAQIAAEELGMDPENVSVTHGDTDVLPDGIGSWASRSTVVGGSAVMLAARALAEEALARGAELLEASVDDVRLAGGRVEVVGSPERSVSLAAIAAGVEALGQATGGRGLWVERVFSVERMTYPYGVHLAQVEIDPDTGEVRVLRYFIAYEIGRAVNPTLVEGQLVGGAAQGVAGALMEEFRYDESGQPLAVSLMDYLVPTAGEVPAVGTLVTEDWPSAGNPLGVKGAGEGGASGCGAAIASAVEDALGRPGSVPSLPIAPEWVRALLARPGP